LKDKDKIESILREQGFSDFAWIDPRSIVVAHWVRIKCIFGCEDYGMATCPPNTPSVQDCDSFFKEYKRCILVRLNVFAHKENYPSAWSKKATKGLLEAERQIFLLGYEKTFLLNQTCCGICGECKSTRIDCVDKKHSRPSPEAFAVDVYSTVRNAGMEIHVIPETPSQINRIALILVD